VINHSYTSQEYEWATMVWRAQRKQEAGSRKRRKQSAGTLQAVSPAERQAVRPSAMQTDKLSWATKRLIN
jgi:hypothetical protein